MPEISIIIVNYNVFKDLLSCIESIQKHLKDKRFEIIVVDNNSTDKSIRQLAEIFPDVKYFESEENKGFGAANNAGLKHALGKYLLLANPDIIFQDEAIKKLHDYLETNLQIAAAGPIQVKPNEGTEYYYSIFPSVYSRFAQEFGLYDRAPLMKSRFKQFWDEKIKAAKPFKVDWVMGSCMMVRKEVYDKLGGFDEAFFLYEEEVDWQFRMKQAGWESYILPESTVLHNHHSSASKLGEMFIKYQEFRSRIIFTKKNYGILKRHIVHLITINAIFLRFIYMTILNFKSFRIWSNRLYLYVDLLKMIFSRRSIVLNSRFSFEKYREYFIDNQNALF